MSKLIAYIGRNHVGGFKGGGIDILEVSADGSSITPLPGGAVDMPKRAGYLAYAPKAGVLYSVDERKTDGRGPKLPASSVMSFKVDQASGALTFLNQQPTVGAMPASITVDEGKKLLWTANHGFFDHVVKAVQLADGTWTEKFEYDDSTVVQYGLNDDGSIGPVQDVHVLTGYGTDPNDSPQGGGHAQASPHAHIVVIDPSGRFMVACEKAGERIYVYRIGGKRLELASVYQCPAGTGPRHVAFHKDSGRMFMTCEFSSELWSFDFDSATGVLSFIDKQSTLYGFTGRNETATVQVHPSGRFVYMNNRGEDDVVWFTVSDDGHLTKAGRVELSRCEDPKDATRAMTLAPSGAFLLVPDRPADIVRAYAVDPNDGSLKAMAEVPVENPVFIQFVEFRPA
jgi:6-phosphogluconolactonase